MSRQPQSSDLFSMWPSGRGGYHRQHQRDLRGRRVGRHWRTGRLNSTFGLEVWTLRTLLFDWRFRHLELYFWTFGLGDLTLLLDWRSGHLELYFWTGGMGHLELSFWPFGLGALTLLLDWRTRSEEHTS